MTSEAQIVSVRRNTAPDPKKYWDGIDRTPQCKGDPDALSQRGYETNNSALTPPPVQPRSEIHNFNPTTLDPKSPKATVPKLGEGSPLPFRTMGRPGVLSLMGTLGGQGRVMDP